MNRTHTAISTIVLSIAGNICLAAIKWVTGYLGHSHALIADAIESTTDIFSSILVLVGIKYSIRPADENHPYGHGRIEPLATFVVVGLLLMSAVVIARQSIHDIIAPGEGPEAYTLIVLAVIIFSKELLFRLVNNRSRETHSTSLRADAWHHRSDAMTSAVVFLGIALSVFFGNRFEAADDWAALLVSAIILYNSYMIFRPALGEIMDEHMHDAMVLQIRKISNTIPGVLGTEKCHIRKTGMQYYVDLHVVVNGGISVAEGHTIAHALKEQIMQQLSEVADVLVHVEPG